MNMVRLVVVSILVLGFVWPVVGAELVSYRRSYGGPGDEMAVDVLVDGNGIYTVGVTTSFGPDPPNAFLTIFNTDNTHRCSVALNVGPGSGDQAVALAAHGGRLFVLGTTTHGPNSPNHFVAVFDASCNMVAFRLFDLGVNEDVREIAVEPAASPMVYVVGGQSVNGAYVAKLNATLGVVWARFFKVRGGDDVANSVTFSGNRVYVGGSSFDGSSFNMFVSVFDTAGSHVATRELASGNEEQGLDVVVAGGSIHLAGFINYPGRQYEAIVAKLDSSLVVQWIKAYGTASGNEYALGMAVSGSLLYLTGMTNVFGTQDVLLTAFDSGGGLSHSFVVSGGPAGDDIGYSVASFGGCVYSVGRHVNWPLFYVVFDGEVNSVSMTVSSVTPSTASASPAVVPVSLGLTSYTPSLDTAASINAFYSKFCPDTLVSTSTTTVTSTVGTTTTSTATVTSTTTAYAIVTTTFTQTSSVIFVLTQTSTSYTTVPVTTTTTVPTTTTYSTTVTSSTTTTATNIVTTTQSTTQTFTAVTTVAFAEPVSTYVLPMLLVMVAVLIGVGIAASRRRGPASQPPQTVSGGF